MAIKKSEVLLAEETWQRYTYALTKGHSDFQYRAKRNEDFYLGGGKQWSTDAKEELEAQGRPWLEPNLIFSIINTVIGYQTQSRLDIAYKPKSNSDSSMAEMLSKLSMHIIDSNKYPWVESSCFADGIIQSRGFLDIRMEFDDNMFGEVKITERDPLDVIPDPDAKSYDPDDWEDVLETRWMTLDDVEHLYGKKKAKLVAGTDPTNDPDFGWGEIGENRNSFAGESQFPAWISNGQDKPRVRVIERQYWKLDMRLHFMDDVTGELDPVPDGMSKKDMNAFAKGTGKSVIKRLTKRVRWTVTTQSVVLHNEWSPYNHFTIVPYFPYFRRGVTTGLVDNLTSTQEMFNKVFSQILHVINTTANSGWLVEENSLTNMDTEDLEDTGAETGLVIEYKAGREAPEKILHNQIPTGLENMADKAAALITTISGVSDVFQGQSGSEVTGAAIQSRVQQNAVQLSAPIDNLNRTRNMVAQRILELIQEFYTEERVFSVTDVDDYGEESSKEVTLNEYSAEADEYLNDVTSGKYDVVISDIPDSVTFQDNQFAQAIELRKFGVEIPDADMIRLSGLSRKNELAKRMSGQTPEQIEAQQQAQQQELEAAQAEIEKLKADAANRNVDSMKKAADTAQIILENPGLATVIQALTDGAGVVNQTLPTQQQGEQLNTPPPPPEEPINETLGPQEEGFL